jgi:hypothetical protein
MVTITIIFFIDSLLIVFVLKPDPKKEGLIIDKETTIEI